jgi:hypothetical protein
VEKVSGYWRAAESSSEQYYPYLAFVIKQEARKAKIERIIRKLPEGQQEMVSAVLLGELIRQVMKRWRVFFQCYGKKTISLLT